MPFLIVAIIIQVFLLVHAIKKGKNRAWIWAFIMFPFISGLAYFFIEMLPAHKKARRSTAAIRQYENVVNADFGDFSTQGRLNSNLDINLDESLDADIKLAEEHFNKGEFELAKTLFEQRATDKNKYEPILMIGIARCAYALMDFKEAKTALDALISHNPDYKNPEAHLLYARTLDALDDIAGATHEFETLHQYFTGPKASFYFAQFLKKHGHTNRANAIFNEILDKASASGGHYDLIYYNILQQVKDELDEV